MNRLALEAVMLSKHAWTEQQLLAFGMYCWLDPIVIADLTRTDSRDPHPTREGIFRYHNCWKCNSGEKPCVIGNPNRCDHPHARND
jgi:hypothetical protein